MTNYIVNINPADTADCISRIYQEAHRVLNNTALEDEDVEYHYLVLQDSIKSFEKNFKDFEVAFKDMQSDLLDLKEAVASQGSYEEPTYQLAA